MQVFMYHDSILKFTTEPNPQTLFSLKLATEKNIQHIFLLIQYRIFASVLKRSKKKKKCQKFKNPSIQHVLCLPPQQKQIP